MIMLSDHHLEELVLKLGSLGLDEGPHQEASLL